MLTIRPATPDDETDISVVVVHAFGQPDEYRLVRALKQAGCVAIELVADDEGQVLGHVCLSELVAPANWLALAPLSVSPSMTGKGIGSEMVRYALDAARRDRFEAVVVVGNPDYYRRFGFVFDGPSELTSPYPAQYLGLYPIAPHSAMAQARLIYPSAFEGV